MLWIPFGDLPWLQVVVWGYLLHLKLELHQYPAQILGPRHFSSSNQYPDQKMEPFGTKETPDLDDSRSDTDSKTSSPFSSTLRFQWWMVEESSQRSNSIGTETSTTRACSKKFSRLDREARFGLQNYRCDHLSGNMREAVSLSRNDPLGPAPLCSISSIYEHKVPVFGKPPRWFTYAELEIATGGFSQANFLAEGGFGSVQKGVLPDGQTVAVKQHKLASSRGIKNFAQEWNFLVCAQHQNVVMLIGFCIEDRRRLLVYECICTGSLDYMVTNLFPALKCLRLYQWKQCNAIMSIPPHCRF